MIGRFALSHIAGHQWEEIYGFGSPGEYDRFVRYIENQVDLGKAEEVTPDPDYGIGEIYGGRWFRNPETDEIWRLVSPDIPFTGLWEPVLAESQ